MRLTEEMIETDKDYIIKESRNEAKLNHEISYLIKDNKDKYEKSNFMDWDSIFHRGCLPSDDACYYGLASFDEKNDIRRNNNSTNCLSCTKEAGE